MITHTKKEQGQKTWKTDYVRKKNSYIHSRIYPNVLKSYASRYFILMMQRGSKFQNRNRNTKQSGVLTFKNLVKTHRPSVDVRASNSRVARVAAATAAVAPPS